jgi:hypothetical protein
MHRLGTRDAGQFTGCDTSEDACCRPGEVARVRIASRQRLLLIAHSAMPAGSSAGRRLQLFNVRQRDADWRR